MGITATSRISVGLFSLAAMVFCGSSALGQNYPSQTIRIITGGVGGATDITSRLIAQGISGPLGTSIVIENRGDGAVGRELVARSAPDGYMLLVGGDDLWIGPLLQKLSYDVIKDFSPISLLTNAPNILVVNPSLQISSVKDLIALAKSKPGALNYASNGIGGSSHLAAELFKVMAGVNIVGVNYPTAGQALTGLIEGQVQLQFATPASVTPNLQSGRLRALAVTSDQQFSLYPDLPTLAASGLPGYESGAHNVIVGPAKIPPAIINRLNSEIVHFLGSPETKQRFANNRVMVVGSSPEELAATIKTQIAKWTKLIQDAGIQEK